MSNPIPQKYSEPMIVRPSMRAAMAAAAPLIPPPSPGCGYQSRDLMELHTRGYIDAAKRRGDGLWFWRVRQVLPA